MPRELASAPPAGPLCRKVARGEPRGHSWLLAALLTAAVFCAYAPSLNGGFVWDDDGHVTAPALRSLGGLWRIWSSVDATQQYYPLLHSAFWLQHRLWGNAALGYRIVNGCLHALVACLFATFCRRLGLPGAYFAGALFALHPVQVESVAWISEQKNTLSAALALASAHLYWRFSDERVASLYAWATVLFGCALLTKTVVSVMPVALLLLLWWQHGIISWRRDVLPLAPWIAVGALGGAITASIERATLGAEGSAFALDGGQRLLLAARAVTFYAGKLLWPAELLFVYPRVVPDVTSWTHYVPVVVLVLWAVACIGALRWWRGPLAVLLLFTCLLVPALGFVDVYPFTFSFVADHFQYLASSSLIALGAAVFEIGRMRFRVCSGIAVAIQAGVLTILGALTWRQSAVWTSNETLFSRTLEGNPRCYLCANNLGVMAWQSGQPETARERFAQAVVIAPDSPEAHGNLANVLAASGSAATAIEHYQASLALAPRNVTVRTNLGIVLLSQGRIAEAREQALDALRVMPSFAPAQQLLERIGTGPAH